MVKTYLVNASLMGSFFVLLYCRRGVNASLLGLVELLVCPRAQFSALSASSSLDYSQSVSLLVSLLDPITVVKPINHRQQPHSNVSYSN